MIDDETSKSIMAGRLIRLETTCAIEDEVMNLKAWLQQFRPVVTVNVFTEQNITRATLWIGALPLDRRSLLAGTLRSNRLNFRILNGNSS